MVDRRVAPARLGRTDQGAWGRTGVALRAILLLTAFALLPGIAFADGLPPHVTPDEGPDACAMCHRAHTAPGVVERSQFGSWETTGSALVLSDPSANNGDVALCLTCHGIDALGSGIDIQSDFASASAHSLLPGASRYAEVPRKQCSSCHDSHGSQRRDDGTLFPGLLRAFTQDGAPFHSAEEYCATCHYDSRDAEDNRFDGLDVYKQTAHARMPGPASGTEITCSNCHASHGSDIAPLILSEITTPAAPAPTTVSGNNRTICYACHTEARATWLGAEVYDDETSATVHGASEFVLPVIAEYASVETTRLAGECQSCHNPMGSDDGEREPVAKLAELEGRELCYSCHNAGNAADITDMSSWGVRPEAIEVEPELIVAWDPEYLASAYGGLHVYTREFGDSDAPFELEGPRRYRVAIGMDGRTGSMAYGDIDGFDDTELVVADPASPVLRVFRSDALAGLAYATHSIAETASGIEVGDVLLDGSGRPEIAILAVEAGGASFLRLYRWESTGPNVEDAVFSQVGAAYPVGYDATGLAVGDLGLSSAATDLVVTARSADATDSPHAVFVLSQPAPGDPVLTAASFTAQADGVRGPSIGPVLNGSPGIVVANAGAATPSISVYSPDGTAHVEYRVYAAPGASAWDTITGTFMSGEGTGVAAAVRNETGMNAVSVFSVTGGGLGGRADVTTGARFASSSLAVGSLIRDDRAQIVVGNAGLLSRTPGDSVSPSVQVIEWTGSAFALTETRWGGGAELAGNAPAVAVADVGPVGRSRHPASAIEGAHVSTETAGFERHVECVDCHNVHAATAEARDSQNAPAAYGAIRGVWGVDVVTGTPIAGIQREYELCFKCHATGGQSPRDIASEFEATSAHPVLGANADVYCVDCHGNAGPGPAGPHVSTASPLLVSPVVGTRPAQAEMLCYDCHRMSLYHDGADPVTETGFRHGDINLHVLHVSESNGHGLGCESCHLSHGSQNEYLIRDGLGWRDLATSGECSAACHSGGRYEYATAGSTWAAQSSGVTQILNSVQLLDDQTGWAVGGGNTILRTTDGGVTWAAAQTPGTPSRVLHDVHFLDGSTGWVAGNVGTIRATTDGGVTWTPQTSGTSQNLRSVHFVDSDTGWAVGDSGTIVATTDGGVTWTPQTSGVTDVLRSVYFVDESTGWVAGARLGGTGAGVILTTTDGGDTWTLRDSGVPRVLHSVHFVDAATGWAVGNAGTVIATTDGGATWTAGGSGVTSRLLSLRFLNRRVGWAAGDAGTVIATTDGGATWAAQDAGTTADLHSVDFINRRLGSVVGVGGSVLRYGFE